MVSKNSFMANSLTLNKDEYKHGTLHYHYSTDIGTYFEEMAKPSSEILTPEVEEKLACALACIYEDEKPHRGSLHTIVTSKINKSGMNKKS